MSAATVRWTSDGSAGISESGYLIHRSPAGAYKVFDADDRYCGSFRTREAAEAVVR